jgi:hypothetical protein
VSKWHRLGRKNKSGLQNLAVPVPLNVAGHDILGGGVKPMLHRKIMVTSPQRPHFRHLNKMLIINGLQNPLKFTVLLNFEVQAWESKPSSAESEDSL